MSKYKLIYNNVNKAIIFVAIFSFAALPVTPEKSFAQIKESLSISPILSEISLIPGQATNLTYTLSNLSNKPLGVSLMPSRTLVIEGLSISQNHDLTSWIQPSQSQLILDPHSTTTINLKINTPLSAKPGSYTGSIFFTPFTSTPKPINSPIVLSNIGALIFSNVGNPNLNKIKTQISLDNFRSFIQPNFPISFSFTSKNNSPFQIVGKPFLTITPLFGTSQTYNLEEKHVLADSSRTWNEQLNSLQPYHLLYFIHLTLSIGQGFTLSKDTLIVVFPLAATVELLALLLIIFFIIKYHKRLRKSLKILVTGKP